MKPLILALLFFTPVAQAFDWPWSDRPDTLDDSCIGFLGSGLADDRVRGWSRTQMWLAWNQFSRNGLSEDPVFQQQYLAGSERYDSITGSDDTLELLAIADGTCDLPREQ